MTHYHLHYPFHNSFQKFDGSQILQSLLHHSYPLFFPTCRPRYARAQDMSEPRVVTWMYSFIFVLWIDVGKLNLLSIEPFSCPQSHILLRYDIEETKRKIVAAGLVCFQLYSRQLIFISFSKVRSIQCLVSYPCDDLPLIASMCSQFYFLLSISIAGRCCSWLFVHLIFAAK